MAKQSTELLEHLEDLRKSRQANFAVQVHEDDHYLFDDEVSLSVTYSGKAWNSMRLTRKEAVQVIDALKKHFGI